MRELLERYFCSFMKRIYLITCLALIFLSVHGQHQFNYNEYKIEGYTCDFYDNYDCNYYADTLAHILIRDRLPISKFSNHNFLVAERNSDSSNYILKADCKLLYNTMPDSFWINTKEVILDFIYKEDQLYILTGCFIIQFTNIDGQLTFNNIWELPVICFKFSISIENDFFYLIKTVKKNESDIKLYEFNTKDRIITNQNRTKIKSPQIFTYNRNNIYITDRYAVIADYVDYAFSLIDLSTMEQHKLDTSIFQEYNQTTSGFSIEFNSKKDIHNGFLKYDTLPCIKKITLTNDKRIGVLFNLPGNYVRLDLFDFNENTITYLESYTGIEDIKYNEGLTIEADSFPLQYLKNPRDLYIYEDKIFNLGLYFISEDMFGKQIDILQSKEFIRSRDKLSIAVYQFIKRNDE